MTLGPTRRAATRRHRSRDRSRGPAIDPAEQLEVFDAALIGMALVGTDGRFLRINRALTGMLGYEGDELLRRTFQDITHPDDLDADLEQLQQCLAGHIDGYAMDKRYICADGREIWVRLDVGVVRDQWGRPSHFVSQIQDITDRLNDLRALADSQARFAALVEHGNDLIAMCRQDGRLVYVSPAYRRVLGRDPEDAVGSSLFDMVHPADRDGALAMSVALMGRPGETGSAEFRVADAEGSWRWFEASVTNRLADPAVEGFVINMRDITEHIEATERLVHRATHDPLTGLPNRALLEDRLVQARASARRHGEVLALLYLDVDFFKDINDRYGHPFGDKLLVVVGQRLTASARVGDTIARLGGDEFVVVAGLGDAQAARELAGRIVDAFDAPLQVEGHTLAITVSVGLALDEDGDDELGLITAADQALYEAKAAGRGQWVTFDRNRDHRSTAGPGPAAVPAEGALGPELTRLAARYRAHVESSEQPIVVHVEGRIVAVSSWAATLVSAAHGDELLGRHVFDFVTNVSLDPASAHDRAALTGGWPTPEVLEIQALDGRRIPVEVSTLPVVWDGRLANQLLLRPVDAEWDQLARHGALRSDQAPDEPIIVTDADLRIVWWNDAAAAFHGWTGREILGSPFTEAVPWSSDDGGIASVLREVYRAGTWSGAAFQRLQDGTVQPGHATVDLVRDDDGRPIGFSMAVAPVDAAPTGEDMDPDLLADLAGAVDRNELVVAYQPIVDAEGRTRKVEALVRWQHPTRGLLLPGSFVPAAEQTPWIRSMTADVLGQACRQVARWREAGAADLELAVNVSGRDLADPALVDSVLDALRASRLPPDALWLEVTETSVAVDDRVTNDGIGRLRAIGVRFALDDFGTGFANLAQLHRFTPQALKIDRVFVDRVGTCEDDAAIVRAVLALGRDLRLTVIAEGVETAEQHERLAALGCELFQGYWYSSPVPPEPTPSWLSRPVAALGAPERAV